jgi:hypothetical protein
MYFDDARFRNVRIKMNISFVYCYYYLFELCYSPNIMFINGDCTLIYVIQSFMAQYEQVGPSWSDVIEECRKAHFQPLLLVYTNPNSTAVDTTKVSNVKLTCNGITCELLKLEMDYTSKLLQQIGS